MIQRFKYRLGNGWKIDLPYYRYNSVAGNQSNMTIYYTILPLSRWRYICSVGSN